MYNRIHDIWLTESVNTDVEGRLVMRGFLTAWRIVSLTPMLLRGQLLFPNSAWNEPPKISFPFEENLGLEEQSALGFQYPEWLKAGASRRIAGGHKPGNIKLLLSLTFCQVGVPEEGESLSVQCAPHTLGREEKKRTQGLEHLVSARSHAVQGSQYHYSLTPLTGRISTPVPILCWTPSSLYLSCVYMIIGVNFSLCSC